MHNFAKEYSTQKYLRTYDHCCFCYHCKWSEFVMSTLSILILFILTMDVPRFPVFGTWASCALILFVDIPKLFKGLIFAGERGWKGRSGGSDRCKGRFCKLMLSGSFWLLFPPLDSFIEISKTVIADASSCPRKKPKISQISMVPGKYVKM